MSRKHFGTDGVRGVANKKLTAEFALQLGLAVGAWIQANGKSRRVVIGRDTRRSGSMLESALASGLCSYGVDVVLVGVAPTPAVAFLARKGDFDFGVIISASHNPAPDNGIKFVTDLGTKSSDVLEEVWEGLMNDIAEGRVPERGTGDSVGTIVHDHEALQAYFDFLLTIVPEGLSGLKIAVDGSNGAAYEIAPEVLIKLGAEVVVTGVRPDGMNINAEGGATKPHVIQAFTLEEGADVGVAFDGDADRAVFSDDKGRLINGDRTIGIWAAHKKSLGELTPSVVVGTIMSNGGFEEYVESLDIRLERAPVGDKYVSAAIEETGSMIGGEQSGHIIFPCHGPTGDGIATALELFRVLKLQGRSSSSFYDDYQPWPQVLVNIEVADRTTWNQSKAVQEVLTVSEAMLQGRGRLNVRPSGTQPMLRVMVEADDYGLRDEVADSIVQTLEKEAGGRVHGRVDLTHALGD